MYLFQLIQEVAELMRNDVRYHGTTLRCVEDVFFCFVLKGRADDVVTQLQAIKDKHTRMTRVCSVVTLTCPN